LKFLFRIVATIKANMRVVLRLKLRLFSSALTASIWGALFILPLTLFFRREDIAIALAYALIAFSMFFLLSTASWIGFNIRRNIMNGIIENQLVSGLSLVEFITAELVTGLLYTIVGIVTFTILASIALGIPALNIVSVTALVIGISGLFLLMWGHAALIGAATLIAGTSSIIIELTSWIIPLVSGMIAPLYKLPEPMKIFALMTPFSHPCELVRYGILGIETAISLQLELVLGITAPLIYVMVGYVAIKYAFNKIRREGFRTPTAR